MVEVEYAPKIFNMNKTNWTIFISLFAVLALGAMIARADWSEPPATGNLDAPINLSVIGQVKTGILAVPRLSVLGAPAKGFVGIGTETPEEKLDVIGNIQIGGLIKPLGDDGEDAQILTYKWDSAGIPRLLWDYDFAWVDQQSDRINPYCNLNGVCDTTENCSICPGDCGCSAGTSCDTTLNSCVGPVCGNTFCENGEYQTQPGYCPSDCANLPPPPKIQGDDEDLVDVSCGNGKLDPGEGCDPPMQPPSNVPDDTCISYCGIDCQAHLICGKRKGGGDWEKPNDPNNIDEPPPDLGGCRDLSKDKGSNYTGVQCGGSCPNPGETCEYTGRTCACGVKTGGEGGGSGF